jgi:hypothetical protein
MLKDNSVSTGDQANLSDYWTKHHPASHHITFRQEILMSQKFITAIGKFNAAAT